MIIPASVFTSAEKLSLMKRARKRGTSFSIHELAGLNFDRMIVLSSAYLEALSHLKDGP